MPLSDECTLPAGWVRCEAEQARSFEKELRREMPKGHILYGAKFEAVARDEKRDDFLFVLEDGRFAMSHLTWSIETDPFWPGTTLYDTYDEWKTEKESDFDEFDDD